MIGLQIIGIHGWPIGIRVKLCCSDDDICKTLASKPLKGRGREKVRGSWKTGVGSMKTISISGKEVKSKTVSLSRAAKYLAKFVKSDNGASEANLGFLKRASAAFNDLNAFHKEIRKLKSRGSKGEDGGGEVVVGFIEDGMSEGNRSEVVLEDGKVRKKKKRRDVQEDGEFDGLNNNGGEVDGRKRKTFEDGKEGRLEDSEEKKLKKKRRKKNREAEAE